MRSILYSLLAGMCILATTRVARCSNNQFLPGDAFFHFVMSERDAEMLLDGTLKVVKYRQGTDPPCLVTPGTPPSTCLGGQRNSGEISGKRIT